MKKKIKHTSYKKRKRIPNRTLADVLADNYISKRELMSQLRESFIEYYQAKKEGRKLRPAEELLDEL